MQDNFLDDFVEFEKQNDLYQLNIQNQHFWFLIRFKLFFKLLNTKKLTKIKSYSDTISPLGKLCRTFLNPYFWFHLIIKNTFRIPDSKLLVINHPRRVFNQGYYECKYTELFLNNTKHPYSVIEYFDDYRHHLPTKTKNLFYIDAKFFMDSIRTKLKSLWFSLKDTDKSILTSLTEKINSSFDVKLSTAYMENLIVTNIIRFQVSKTSCASILKRVNPKLIFFTSYYSRLDWVAAAREQNIRTVEIQHGTAGSNHIAYNISARINPNFLPDYFFLFGHYWKDTLHLSIPKDNFFSVGFPFLEKNIENIPTLKKPEPREIILFLSQPTIGENLAQTALELQQYLDKSLYKIIFKLHPWEYSRAKNTYAKLLSQSGVKVVCNEKGLYELFNSASYQIGVYSTALYEGIAFSLKTFIVKLLNYHTMSYLYENQIACLVDNAGQIIKQMDSFKFKKSSADLLWQKNSLKRYEQSINNILN